MIASTLSLSHLLILLSFLLIVGAENESALTPVAYWCKMFPNTTMPQNIRDLIPNGEQPVERMTRGDSWLTGSQFASMPYRNLWADINRQPRSIVSNGRSKRNFSSNVSPVFFLEKDLKPGSKMVVTVKSQGKGNDNGRPKRPTFLSHKGAEKVPFAISRYSEILRMFSIKRHSLKADLVKQALHDCEMHALAGETKFCASSPESMIRFAISQLGTKDIHVLATSITNMKEEQEYRVDVHRVKLKSLKVMTCHSIMYPYAVLYCHRLRNTRLYMVPLAVGEDDGSRVVHAVAVCHADTASWNPRHLSFQLLGVQPGTIPICHFLSEESIAWVPK